MKSIVNNPKPDVKKKPFPKLMVNESNYSIWLMSDKETGVLVSKGNSLYDIAQHTSKLIGVTFVDFEGSVTLSND